MYWLATMGAGPKTNHPDDVRWVVLVVPSDHGEVTLSVSVWVDERAGSHV